MTKAIYRWDMNMYLVSTDSVVDDYKLQPNETFIAPDKVEKSTVKWAGSSWRQLTDEEDAAYIKAHLGPAPISNQPADDKGNEALNLLGQQLAQVQAQQATLASSVNALGQMVAKAQAQKQA